MYKLIQALVDSSVITKFFIAGAILFLSLVTSLLLRFKILWYKILGVLLLQAVFGLLLTFISRYWLLAHIAVYAIPSYIFGFAIYAFTSPSKEVVSTSAFAITWTLVSGKKRIIDVLRGLGILGAAGSGKTESFMPIYSHIGATNAPGISFDYKDFELTEKALSFLSKSTTQNYIISPARPELSNCINPIEPKYLKTFNDCNTFASDLIANLAVDTKEKFFLGAAESAVSAIIWRTKEDYPAYCHLPMVSAIIMTKNSDEIVAYIKRSQYASVLGKTFLEGQSGDGQMAAVMGTLSEAFRKIVSPELFSLFTKSDFQLDINNPANPGFIHLVSHPKYNKFISPFLSVVMRSTIMQMSERNRLPSYLLIDEASKMKLTGLEEIPATLRTYLIATILGFQDKVQAVRLYTENGFKEIFTNIGARLMGKANDPDTAEWYQKFFEFVKEKTISISRGTGFLDSGDTRESVSEKERSKIRAQEFYKLLPGEFVILDEKGESEKVRFRPLQYLLVKPKALQTISPTEMKLNFDTILERAKYLE